MKKNSKPTLMESDTQRSMWIIDHWISFTLILNIAIFRINAWL